MESKSKKVIKNYEEINKNYCHCISTGLLFNPPCYFNEIQI
ncbi:hypothetical protein DOY81_001158 [Sarcophaga bullata]|nr:hypothetical protein DOY81_001158 [Sarcophaga bullata]